MLVLGRRERESIVILDSGVAIAAFRILTISKGQVRVGVEADKDLEIYRLELLSRPNFKDREKS